MFTCFSSKNTLQPLLLNIKFLKMKKILCMIICALIFAKAANAQIPNAGFEQLDSLGVPKNWASTDAISIGINDSIIIDGFTIGKTSQAYTGLYALELRNSFNVTQNVPFFYGKVNCILPDSTVYQTFTKNIPINYKPYALNFYYRVTQNPYGDSTKCNVQVYNATGDIIGEGNLALWNITNNYNAQDIKIIYFTNTPEYLNDSIPVNTRISFKNVANLNVTGGIGYRFQLDDLSFSAAPLSNIKLINVQNIKAYPNPVKRILYIDAPQDKGAVNFINTKGQIVAQTNLQNGRATINVANFASGVYYLNINGHQKIVQIIE